MTLNTWECGVCHQSIEVSEDWMEVAVQMGDVTVNVTVCEEHAGIIRQNVARKIVQAT